MFVRSIRLMCAAVIGCLCLSVAAASAAAQINGQRHNFYWTAVLTPNSLETTCNLYYQHQVYPSSTSKTSKLVGQLSCAPVGIGYGNFFMRARDSRGNVLFDQRFECPRAAGAGCAGPGNPWAFGPTVSVPRNTFVSWDLRRLALYTGGTSPIPNPGGPLDPWITAPFDHACTIGTEWSECYRDFTANDPEDPVWGRVE